MIVLICGPSGSGKTTLLRQIAMMPRARIHVVTVSRKDTRNEGDIAKVEVSLKHFKRFRFPYIYYYDDSVYGFSLSQEEIDSLDYVFLDYPGEYPSCPELRNIDWRGLLVLPPSRDDLMARLTRAHRAQRTASALMEYDEIQREIAIGEYADEAKWQVFYSKSLHCGSLVVDAIKHERLFMKAVNR